MLAVVKTNKALTIASETARYPLNGGMQDFNYIFTNDMEITLELSCCKYPKRWQSLPSMSFFSYFMYGPTICYGRYYLNKEWERNHKSLISYLEQVFHWSAYFI